MIYTRKITSLPVAEIEVKFNSSGLLASSFCHQITVPLQTVSLDVKFSPENDKLFLLAFRLLAKEMIPIKVTPQFVVVLIEIL